jgi:hypothetical protein
MKAILLLLVVGCGEVKNTTVDAAKSDGPTPDQGIAIDAPADADLSPHKVFITSTNHSGSLNGLAGADAICQARAQTAGLTGMYKAWLADANLTPATRMTHGLGPYQLVSGTVIATSWTDLTDGTLAAPVNRTEVGGLLGGSGCTPGPGCNFICEGGEFWSNVAADGTRNTATGDCGTWTGTGQGTAGNVGKTTAAWTTGTCSSIGCGSTLPFLCVQQ